MILRLLASLLLVLATALPAAAEFPTVTIFFIDGSVRVIDPANLAPDWQAVPETGIVSIRATLSNGTEYQLSGGDKFWAYVESANTIVFGVHRPALDEGTPNEVPESFTEVVYDRRAGRGLIEREVTAVPASATVKRWFFGP